jgi:predicted CoA-binding protein
MTSEIQAFLALRRIAMIGVSHEPKHFSRAVFRAWRDRGYDMVPVNPVAAEIEGAQSFAHVQDVTPAVDAVLVLTLPAVSEKVVADCVAAGIRHVWLYRRSPAAESLCVQKGIDFVTGECPLMYLQDMAWPHRLHRWLHTIRQPAA